MPGDVVTTMNEQRFQSLARMAKLLPGDYGAGYQRGLRRHYYGARFGTEEEHQLWSQLGTGGDLRIEMGRGYRDGLAGIWPEMTS